MVCKMTALWLLNYVLQTISVAVLYVVGFTGPTFVLGAVTLYQLFRYTPLWPFVILYLSWVFLIDWKTPERGGRDLLRNFARRLAIFKYMKDYYPITLVKTSELDPQKNYIFGYHPHGFFTEGASIGFGTDACGFGGNSRELFLILQFIQVRTPFPVPWHFLLLYSLSTSRNDGREGPSLPLSARCLS